MVCSALGGTDRSDHQHGAVSQVTDLSKWRPAIDGIVVGRSKATTDLDDGKGRESRERQGKPRRYPPPPPAPAAGRRPCSLACPAPAPAPAPGERFPSPFVSPHARQDEVSCRATFPLTLRPFSPGPLPLATRSLRYAPRHPCLHPLHLEAHHHDATISCRRRPDGAATISISMDRGKPLRSAVYRLIAQSVAHCLACTFTSHQPRRPPSSVPC